MARKKASLEDLDAEIARLEAELEALEHGMSPSESRKAAKDAEASARAGEDPRAVADAAPARGEAADADAAPAKKKRGLLGLRGKKAKDADAGHAEAAARSADDADAPAEQEKKSRFGLLGRGKRKDESPALPAATEDPVADAPAPDDADSAKPAKKGLFGKLPVPALKKGKAGNDTPAADAAPHEDEPEAASEAAPAAPATDLAPPRMNGASWSRADDVWRRSVSHAEPETVRRVVDADGTIVEEAPATADDLAALEENEEREAKGRKLLGFLGRK